MVCGYSVRRFLGVPTTFVLSKNKTFLKIKTTERIVIFTDIKMRSKFNKGVIIMFRLFSAGYLGGPCKDGTCTGKSARCNLATDRCMCHGKYNPYLWYKPGYRGRYP